MAEARSVRLSVATSDVENKVLPTLKRSFWQRFYRLLDAHSGRVLLLMILLYVVVFSAASAYKWETYQTGYDQVYFQQPLWNTIHGRFMQQSDFNYSDSAFAVDFMPLLVAFVPFFWLVPSPHTLFFLESLILGLGALPIFWLARDKLQNQVAALGFVAVYMLNPTLEYFNLLPFNLRASGLVLLLYAFYFFEKRRFWLFTLCAGLAMLTRTEVSLVVTMFGFYGLLHNFWAARSLTGAKTPGYARFGVRFWLTPLIAGLAYFVVVLYFILPIFIQPGTMVLPPTVTANGPVQLSQKQLDYIAGSNTLIATNYGDLGQSLPDVLKNTLTHPDKTFKRVVTIHKFEYLLAMLLPFAFLNLFAPSLLLFALPIVGINLLSIRPSQYDYTTHYSALLLFPLTIGAIYGIGNLLEFLQKRNLDKRFKIGQRQLKVANLPSLMLGLVLVLAATQLIEKNPLPGVVRNAEKHNIVANINKIVKQIPPDAAVTATSFLGSHLQPRQYSYDFPLALYQPPPSAMQYILLDTNAAALYVKDNGVAFGGELPIDYVQKSGQWKLILKYTVKGQLDRRQLPREIQLWQSVNPNTPPLIQGK